MSLARLVSPNARPSVVSFLASGNTGVTPRHASTVVLVRDGDGSPGGLELYFLLRHGSVDFAHHCVFPGGGVDPGDSDESLAWHQAPDLADGTIEAPVIAAAIRETFEEAGVLFASRETTGPFAVADGEDWDRQRVAVESRSLPFAELLSRHGLALRPELLHYWRSWVTPITQSRRFQTHFFVAAVDRELVAREQSSESDRNFWMPVREAITRVDVGELVMLPPTYAMCLELYEARSAREALDLTPRGPARATVLSTLLPTETGLDLLIPDCFDELDAEVHRAMTEP